MSCITFGHGVRNRARNLPQYDPSAPMQSCAKLKARLTVAACAERSRLADKLVPDEWWQASCCRGCETGRKNREVRNAL